MRSWRQMRSTELKTGTGPTACTPTFHLILACKTPSLRCFCIRSFRASRFFRSALRLASISFSFSSFSCRSNSLYATTCIETNSAHRITTKRSFTILARYISEVHLHQHLETILKTTFKEVSTSKQRESHRVIIDQYIALHLYRSVRTRHVTRSSRFDGHLKPFLGHLFISFFLS